MGGSEEKLTRLLGTGDLFLFITVKYLGHRGSIYVATGRAFVAPALLSILPIPRLSHQE